MASRYRSDRGDITLLEPGSKQMVAHHSLEGWNSSFWAEIDGQRMHYQKAGSGPPLLLIHGLLGGSFCWRLNIADQL